MHDMERQLWCAVLKQAIDDATSLVRNGSEQSRARAWFRGASKDFQHVCHLAGYEPDRIRAMVLKKIDAIKHLDVDLPERRQMNKNSLHHYAGRSLTVAQWSAATGIGTHVFYAGLKRGKSIGEILEKRKIILEQESEESEITNAA